MALPILVERLSALAAFTRLRATLPRDRGHQAVSGLAGSADAVLLASLVAADPNRLFVVVADQLPEAERWLADLQSVLGEEVVVLYPPREGFGEVEPHAEVAGERVETLEKLSRGKVRVLLTTARAIQERTRLPRALASARLELVKGAVHRLEDLVAHLERVGFERPVQGNLDPVALLAPWRELRYRIDDVLERAAGRPGHVFNVGHGLTPRTPVDNVRRLVEHVRERTAT